MQAVDGRSFAGKTLRQVVHLSIGGDNVRIRLTNRFGDAPITIADAAVAIKAEGAGPKPGSVRRLTFMSSGSVTIPPHADVISDPASLAVSARSDVLVDLYIPAPVAQATEHTLAYQTNYEAAGDLAGSSSAQRFAATYTSWYFLDGVDVSDTAARGAVVALGDSITDGAGGKLNANDRWTDFLFDRIGALPENAQLGVLDEGISGNRILLSESRFGVDALARMDADVLSQSGAVDVIVLLGINDIQQKPHQYDAQRIEQGLEQIAVQAHSRGLRVIGCTITPYAGWLTYDETGEATRLAVNDFIRRSTIFDGLADFDEALRDPQNPHRLATAYDSGDHLHPNSAGHRAMAQALNLSQL